MTARDVRYGRRGGRWADPGLEAAKAAAERAMAERREAEALAEVEAAERAAQGPVRPVIDHGEARARFLVLFGDLARTDGGELITAGVEWARAQLEAERSGGADVLDGQLAEDGGAEHGHLAGAVAAVELAAEGAGVAGAEELAGELDGA